MSPLCQRTALIPEIPAIFDMSASKKIPCESNDSTGPINLKVEIQERLRDK